MCTSSCRRIFFCVVLCDAYRIFRSARCGPNLFCFVFFYSDKCQLFEYAARNVSENVFATPTQGKHRNVGEVNVPHGKIAARHDVSHVPPGSVTVRAARQWTVLIFRSVVLVYQLFVRFALSEYNDFRICVYIVYSVDLSLCFISLPAICMFCS